MRIITATAAVLVLAGCSTGSATHTTSSRPTASSAAASPSGLTPQQRARINADLGYPADPDPATKAGYVRDLDAIDRDIVHGKADKAVSRGKDTCRSIKETGDQARLVQFTGRRFTSPTHPEGRSPAVAARILDVIHERLCPTY
jgi:hypothetical protein